MSRWRPKRAGSHTRAVAKKRKRVLAVVDACHDVLARRVGLVGRKPIGCGVQGCVFPTNRKDTVVKITVGASNEAGPVMWRLHSRRDSHWSLPEIHRVGKLTHCQRALAARDREQHAYVTVREDVSALPRFPKRVENHIEHLILKLENAVERGTIRTMEQGYRWMTRLEKQDREFRALPARAKQMVLSMADLFSWAASNGVVMKDIHRENVGFRRRRGGGIDIVVRDIGFIRAKRKARIEHRERFTRKYVDRHAERLGALFDAPGGW